MAKRKIQSNNTKLSVNKTNILTKVGKVMSVGCVAAIVVAMSCQLASEAEIISRLVDELGMSQDVAEVLVKTILAEGSRWEHLVEDGNATPEEFNAWYDQQDDYVQQMLKDVHDKINESINQNDESGSDVGNNVEETTPGEPDVVYTENSAQTNSELGYSGGVSADAVGNYEVVKDSAVVKYENGKIVSVVVGEINVPVVEGEDGKYVVQFDKIFDSEHEDNGASTAGSFIVIEDESKEQIETLVNAVIEASIAADNVTSNDFQQNNVGRQPRE